MPMESKIAFRIFLMDILLSEYLIVDNGKVVSPSYRYAFKM